MRLRDCDIRLARSRVDRDPAIALITDAEHMLRHCRFQLIKLGISIVVKPKTSLRLSKMSTAYYRQIRVASDWSERSTESKAITLAHELVHVRQWRRWGQVGFATRYACSQRFRWAVEVQAYCESVTAMRVLGRSDKTVARYIEARADALVDAYRLRRIAADVRRHTARVLAG